MSHSELLIVVLLSVVGTLACQPSSTPPSSDVEAPATVAATDTFEPQARALTDKFQKELKQALQTAMAQGGPAHAIGVCSEKAPALTAATKANGLVLRRIGVRARNKKTNVPTEGERQVLAQLESTPEYVGSVDGRTTYMRAIRIGSPVCLQCHGDANKLIEPVREALKERYPNDEATGFALQDLRGAFVVQPEG